MLFLTLVLQKTVIFKKQNLSECIKRDLSLMGSGTAQSRVTSFFFQEIYRIPPALLQNISTTCFLLQSDFSALFFRRHFDFLRAYIKDDFGAKRGDLNLNILLLSAKKRQAERYLLANRIRKHCLLLVVPIHTILVRHRRFRKQHEVFQLLNKYDNPRHI